MHNMDFLERIWNAGKAVVTRFGEFWENFTVREKLWVGGTVVIGLWASVFGGAMVQGALIAGVITTIGAMWIATYSMKFADWVLANRAAIDICASFPALFAPLVLGATMGMLVVFANLFLTSSLVFFAHWRTAQLAEEKGKGSDDDIIDVEWEAVPAA